MTNKRLGQHFLKNDAVIKKIVAAADIKRGDIIVEIGPGKGALTLSLAAACSKTGAKLIAIEKDEALIKNLQEIIDDLEIVHGDALDLLQSADFISRLHAPFKIVGNIPYYITGHLFRIVGELKPQSDQCVFMIQQEVAERIIAQPPKMNRLAASVQFWAETKIIARLGKEDFSPVPKVNSAVVAISARHPEATSKDSLRYYRAVQALFAQPRKTILNNLAASALADESDKKEIMDELTKLGISSVLRPQNLTIQNIDDIAKAF